VNSSSLLLTILSSRASSGIVHDGGRPCLTSGLPPSAAAWRTHPLPPKGLNAVNGNGFKLCGREPSYEREFGRGSSPTERAGRGKTRHFESHENLQMIRSWEGSVINIDRTMKPRVAAPTSMRNLISRVSDRGSPFIWNNFGNEL
jgi:hypothetical protein